MWTADGGRVNVDDERGSALSGVALLCFAWLQAGQGLDKDYLLLTTRQGK